MDAAEFDPRAARMPGSTERDIGGVVPGACAGSGDHPDPRPQPFIAFVTVYPARMSMFSDGVERATVCRGGVLVMDFYRGRP